MYRYGRYFRLFYRYPAILETVSIAWVNMENLFIGVQRHEMILAPMCLY